MSKLHLTNAHIVLPADEITNGSLLIEDGIITAINPLTVLDALEINLEGKTLIPGMIDLHCDALEKEVEPRPGVHFPIDFAVAQADKRNAAAGITTVYHALSFANDELGVRSNDMAAQLVRGIHQWQPHGLVDNRVHCRYEITDESGMPVLAELIENNEMHLLSLMDHTPGQGQFKDIAAYRTYLKKTYGRTEDDLNKIIDQKQSAAEGAMARVEQLINMALAKGISVASHDDDCAGRIESMSALGVNISEFPINMETAHLARSKGMRTVMGAPNILRGKSQSGSMRAIDAIHADAVDCLCADYAPASLIVALYKIVEMTELNLSDALALVTVNPAKAAGLNDRGEIVIGKRADLIAISTPAGLPQVSSVWVKGVNVFKSFYDHG